MWLIEPLSISYLLKFRFVVFLLMLVQRGGGDIAAFLKSSWPYLAPLANAWGVGLQQEVEDAGG